MEILVYRGKHGNIYIDMSSPEAFTAGWLYLFNLIDNMGYYDVGDSDEPNTYPRSYAKILQAARHGDSRAARAILEYRRYKQYEGWEIETVIQAHLEN